MILTFGNHVFNKCRQLQLYISSKSDTVSINPWNNMQDLTSCKYKLSTHEQYLSKVDEYNIKLLMENKWNSELVCMYKLSYSFYPIQHHVL